MLGGFRGGLGADQTHLRGSLFLVLSGPFGLFERGWGECFVYVQRFLGVSRCFVDKKRALAQSDKQWFRMKDGDITLYCVEMLLIGKFIHSFIYI